MNRDVYLSYDRLNDIWRAQMFAQVVGGLIRPRIMIPSADWNNVDEATAEIRTLLALTSVTVVLIGSNAAGQPWVRYELDQSIARGNGILGVHIHNMKDHNGDVSAPGAIPSIRDDVFFTVYDWDQSPGRFWKEVKAAATRSAQSKRRVPLYFPSLGW